MNDGWMFENNGMGFGPFSQSQLQQLLVIGLLNPDDDVWQGADKRRRKAADLIPLAKRPSASFPPSRWRVPQRVLAVGAGFVVVGVGIVSSLLSVRPSKPDAEAVATKDSEPTVKASMPEAQAVSLEPAIPVVEAESLAATPADVTPQAMHSDAKTVGVVVEGNVALASRGAVVEGVYRDPAMMLDGRREGKDGMGKAHLKTPIVVTLAETYRLRQVKMNLIPAWLKERGGDKDSYYQYTVEVSADGRDFQQVADRCTGIHRGWQTIDFTPRPVKAIRIVGTNAFPLPNGIRIAELEAYCSRPE